jgi:iron-sulfur cluster repair protein YtfE (RIC family)
MFIYIYEYKGDFCSGGYACIAESEENARKLLAELKKKSDDIIEKQMAQQYKRKPREKAIFDIIKQLFENKNYEHLELIFQSTIVASEEKIIFNSFDCC